MFIKLSRTFKAGWKNLVRNGSLAVATVGIIVITLFIINLQGATIFANHHLLEDAKDKVNISVYVDTEVSEDDTMKIKGEIESFTEVKEVVYISRDEALDDFKEFSSGNETIQKAIAEIGENPLGAVLNVKANNPDDYKKIAEKIEQGNFKDKVKAVNYHKYKGIIDNVGSAIKSIQRFALISGVTFSLIAILITFNSIRITMYAHRKEIEVMRLVGASNNYIRLPFLWEGVFYGLIATLIAIPLSYFYLNFVANDGGGNEILFLSNAKFLREFIGEYFPSNFLVIIITQILLGISLGVISSVIAIRRYLKV